MAAQKTITERLTKIEVEIDCFRKEVSIETTYTRKDMEAIKASINGLGSRLDEMRRAAFGRVWSVLAPIATAIITGILMLVFGGKIQ